MNLADSSARTLAASPGATAASTSSPDGMAVRASKNVVNPVLTSDYEALSRR